ncbi:MAG: trigger factor [Proteobacteria bacterium]|nr:trigger factor [Pseudomonadota bacterium]
MQVRIEDVSPVEKKLIVEVPWSTVDKKLSTAYRELSRNVQLRGFRKGKVPRSVLQRMYGKHVRAEVTSQLVRESFLTATSEHNLQAVAEPRMEDAPNIKKGEPLSFEAIVEVKGEVVAKDYNGMELTHQLGPVTDEDVDRAIEALRREHAELLPIEGRDITARTDHLTVKLIGTIGSQEIDQPRMQVDLSEPANEPLPGLVEALLGLPLNIEDHDLELAIPDEFPDQSAAGQKAILTASIVDARQKQLPELDDDFAIDIDRGETVAELRENVQRELNEQRDQELKRLLREAALKELIERNEIPVAPALVERGVELQYQRLQHMLGIPHDHETSDLTESMRESLRPIALKEVRGELLLESVAEQEKIEITADDLDKHIAEMAQPRNIPPAKLRAELDRDGQLEHIEFQLRRDMTLDILVDRANLKEIDPSEVEEPAEQGAKPEAQLTEPDGEGGEVDSEASGGDASEENSNREEDSDPEGR